MDTASFIAVGCRACHEDQRGGDSTGSDGEHGEGGFRFLLPPIADHHQAEGTGSNISNLVPVSVTSVSDSCRRTRKNKLLHIALFNVQSVGYTSALKRIEIATMLKSVPIEVWSKALDCNQMPRVQLRVEVG